MANGMQTVAVYCGSNVGKNPAFASKTTELGAYLASKQIAVIYGGSRYGLLGKLCDSVVTNGGKITGIIPDFFLKYEAYSAGCEEIVVPDMHTRKKMMFDRSDAFIALPGGLGTMEELTEILTWSKLNLHNKPVGLLNVNGYYDHFLKWLDEAIAEGFVKFSSVEEVMVVSPDPVALVDELSRRWAVPHTTNPEINEAF